MVCKNRGVHRFLGTSWVLITVGLTVILVFREALGNTPKYY